MAKTPSRAVRNNNPGNLMYNSLAAAKAKGAIGLDTKGIPGGAGYAIFPSVDAGLNAALALIKRPKYQKGTLYDAIATWAPPDDGHPANKGNNPKAYAAAVSKKSGIPVNAQMKSLTDGQLKQMLGAMFGVESGGEIAGFGGNGTAYPNARGAVTGILPPKTTPANQMTQAGPLPYGPSQGVVPMPLPAQLPAYTGTVPVPSIAPPDQGQMAQLPFPGSIGQASTSAINSLMQMGATGLTGRVRVLFDPKTGRTVTRSVGG